MNDMLQKFVNAIIRQEGMKPDYPNPGNLRAAPWLTKPTIVNNFWVPKSRAEGIAGVAHVVALRAAMGQTTRQIISAWAPPSDHNDTEKYIKNLASWCGIVDVDKPLMELMNGPTT